LNETETPADKGPEKVIHQIAKYEEVDLKAYREKNRDSVKISSPSSINSLLILNTSLIIMLVFYLKYLHGRINDIYFITHEHKN
jgi:hypothetical protein